jgi:ATP-dependent RNA helicase RhlE
LIGCAQTGTGKQRHLLYQLYITVSYRDQKAKVIRALVVTPTRELAVQIGQSFDTYAKYTNLTQLTIFGGVSQNPQVDAKPVLIF